MITKISTKNYLRKQGDENHFFTEQHKEFLTSTRVNLYCKAKSFAIGPHYIGKRWTYCAKIRVLPW